MNGFETCFLLFGQQRCRINRDDELELKKTGHPAPAKMVIGSLNGIGDDDEEEGEDDDDVV